jgi:hypothetical protein
LIRLRSRTDDDQDADLPDEVPMHRRRPDVDRGLVHATHYACAPDADIAGAVHQVNAMTRTIAIVAIALTWTSALADGLYWNGYAWRAMPAEPYCCSCRTIPTPCGYGGPPPIVYAPPPPPVAYGPVYVDPGPAIAGAIIGGAIAGALAGPRYGRRKW